jgi:hypothetical protein
MRGELVILPGETYRRAAEPVDPGRIRAEREALKAWLGTTLASEWKALHDRTSAVPYGLEAAARARASSRPRLWSISRRPIPPKRSPAPARNMPLPTT